MNEEELKHFRLLIARVTETLVESSAALETYKTAISATRHRLKELMEVADEHHLDWRSSVSPGYVTSKNRVGRGELN